MTIREPNLDTIAIFNGILTPVDGAQQKVAFTGASGQSSAFTTDIITIFATENCWIRFGSNPTAAANDSNSVYLPSLVMRSFRVKITDKLAVIRDTASGTLHINGGA